MRIKTVLAVDPVQIVDVDISMVVVALVPAKVLIVGIVKVVILIIEVVGVVVVGVIIVVLMIVKIKSHKNGNICEILAIKQSVRDVTSCILLFLNGPVSGLKSYGLLCGGSLIM